MYAILVIANMTGIHHFLSLFLNQTNDNRGINTHAKYSSRHRKCPHRPRR